MHGWSRNGVAIVTAALAVVLGATACSRFSRSDRTHAVGQLRQVDGLLTDLDRTYSAGDRSKARELAENIDNLFDNSTAETVVTEIDRPLHRELEPILEKELYAKVDAGAPVAEVSALIAQGHTLVARAIREIGR